MIVYVDGFNLYYGAVRARPTSGSISRRSASVCSPEMRSSVFAISLPGSKAERETLALRNGKKRTFERFAPSRACRFMRATFGRTSGEGD